MENSRLELDKRGNPIFGRFKVHPDKLLLRIWPIKAIDPKSGLWLSPAAQRREMTHRWARILQVGERVEEYHPGLFKIGEIVLVQKNVDQVYGREGKFKLGGKFVCVTMATEILCAVDDDGSHNIPEYVINSGVRNE